MTIFTAPVMTGARTGRMTLTLGGGSGSMDASFEINCVIVTVMVPATVPSCTCPPPGSVAAVDPAEMVKFIVVPPAANCIAGSW